MNDKYGQIEHRHCGDCRDAREWWTISGTLVGAFLVLIFAATVMIRGCYEKNERLAVDLEIKKRAMGIASERCPAMPVECQPKVNVYFAGEKPRPSFEPSLDPNTLIDVVPVKP